jgi:hypothetical protein
MILCIINVDYVITANGITPNNGVTIQGMPLTTSHRAAMRDEAGHVGRIT